MQRGLFHLYFGEGKGKTTAAMGLALRALGCGKKVVILQFLKNGTSSELNALKKLGAEVISGKITSKFVFAMSEEEKIAERNLNNTYLEKIETLDCDLLILDEACGANALHMLSEEKLKQVVLNRDPKTEIVLTGRNPSTWMIENADYITEMKKIRHPYDKGIKARKGIEY